MTVQENKAQKEYRKKPPIIKHMKTNKDHSYREQIDGYQRQKVWRGETGGSKVQINSCKMYNPMSIANTTA